MPTLILRFPGRRYHATPWGHHVNEGLIEWPPSPWRLLRALLSVGYTAGVWNGTGPPATARALIEKLATKLPRYCLPPAAGAHSRHYMPIGEINKGREKTTLVFDTWAQVDNGELAVTWDVDLAAEEVALLSELVTKLGYLGRSESWVLARLAEPNEFVMPEENSYPCDSPPTIGWEQVSLLAPVASEKYIEWRQKQIDILLTELPPVEPPAKKRLTKRDLKQTQERELAREKAQAPFPPDLIACLQALTSWLKHHGWSQPPGSRRVLYWRKSNALEAGVPRRQRRIIEAPPVEAVLLAMATASGNDHALPRIARALPQAERLHKQLVDAFKRANHDAHSKALTGCDEAGAPLRGAHEHAHILPLDLDGDGHLEHFLIWAPMKLHARAQAAIRAVRRTFSKGGIGPLQLALAGSGALADLRGLPGVYGDGLCAVLGAPNGATEWVSFAPFVPPRYLKKRGRNTLEGQVAAELSSRGHPAPTEVRVIDPHNDDRARRQRHFIRSRRLASAPPIDCGMTLLLRFGSPVKGPLCLGYGSHFGLGLFIAN